MLKLSRILMCFLVTLLVTSCVDDNVVDTNDEYFSMLKRLPSPPLPIDLDSVDALQCINVSDVPQGKTSILNGDGIYSNKYSVLAVTNFRERPLEASNLFCNGVKLLENDDGWNKYFARDWQNGIGPYNQAVRFQFVRDGETVYDTIQTEKGFGEIRFLDTNGNESPQLNITAPSSNYNVVWENTGSDDIVLWIGLTYMPKQDGNGQRYSTLHTVIVPNTGSFNITRSFLETNLGLDFADIEIARLSIILEKFRYKVKNYGPNNKKTLLTMHKIQTSALIDAK